MAKLSVVEKCAIQGAMAQDKSVAEIAKMLNRTEKVVSNYIDDLGTSLIKVEEVRAQLARGKRVGEVEVVYGEAQEVRPIAKPKTEIELLREENEALKAQLAEPQDTNAVKSADKIDRENPPGVHAIKRNVGGKEVVIGAVGSKESSERADELKKLSRPSTSFGNFIAPIKRKK